MAYNKQVNPYGIASSELGWRGFADGGKHGNPAAIAPPKDTTLAEAAIKGAGVLWDEYEPMKAKKLGTFGADATSDISSEMEEMYKIGSNLEIDSEERDAARQSYSMLSSQLNRIKSNPNYGKDVYNEKWYNWVPDKGIRADESPKYTRGYIDPYQNYLNKEEAFWKAEANPKGNYYEGEVAPTARELREQDLATFGPDLVSKPLSEKEKEIIAKKKIAEKNIFEDFNYKDPFGDNAYGLNRAKNFFKGIF